jgi:uncharacterized ferritin-like protein (DUF455 family)
MFRRSEPGPDSSDNPVIEVLQRLWQTKLSGIALLEKWRQETSDAEIRAGLQRQIIDERQHARLIGEQIRRLGGRIGSQVSRDGLARVFAEAEASREDVQRLMAFYRGVKAYTLDRCAHLMPYVDRALAQTLDLVSRDEERHMRWADVRLERLLTYEKMRECNLLLSRVWANLESAWGKQWRQLTVGFRRQAGRTAV